MGAGASRSGSPVLEPRIGFSRIQSSPNLKDAGVMPGSSSSSKISSSKDIGARTGSSSCLKDGVPAPPTMMVVGISGVGKTSLVLRLLLHLQKKQHDSQMLRSSSCKTIL
jgi:hypothetical protein